MDALPAAGLPIRDPAAPTTVDLRGLACARPVGLAKPLRRRSLGLTYDRMRSDDLCRVLILLQVTARRRPLSGQREGRVWTQAKGYQAMLKAEPKLDYCDARARPSRGP